MKQHGEVRTAYAYPRPFFTFPQAFEVFFADN